MSRGPTVSAICPCTSRANVRAWIRTASGPSSATMSAARAKRKSPTRIAMELPQRALALCAPRRTGASSITSSWYSVARWVSSTTVADSTTSALPPPPISAATAASSGRNRLPPASTRCRAASATSGSSLVTARCSCSSTAARVVRIADSRSGSVSSTPIEVPGIGLGGAAGS